MVIFIDRSAKTISLGFNSDSKHVICFFFSIAIEIFQVMFVANDINTIDLVQF